MSFFVQQCACAAVSASRFHPQTRALYLTSLFLWTGKRCASKVCFIFNFNFNFIGAITIYCVMTKQLDINMNSGVALEWRLWHSLTYTVLKDKHILSSLALERDVVVVSSQSSRKLKQILLLPWGVCSAFSAQNLKQQQQAYKKRKKETKTWLNSEEKHFPYVVWISMISYIISWVSI